MIWGLDKPPNPWYNLIILKKGIDTMRCADNCGYWYADEDEDYPSCHFDHDSPWPAPCEYDGEEDDTDCDYDDYD